MEDKLSDFLQQMDNVWIVMNHRRNLQRRSRVLNWLAAGDWYYQIAGLTLSIAILLILFFSCTNATLDDPRARGFSPQVMFSGTSVYPTCNVGSEGVFTAVQVLGLLHVVAAFMLSFGFVMDRGPILTQKTHLRRVRRFMRSTSHIASPLSAMRDHANADGVGGDRSGGADAASGKELRHPQLQARGDSDTGSHVVHQSRETGRRQTYHQSLNALALETRLHEVHGHASDERRRGCNCGDSTCVVRGTLCEEWQSHLTSRNVRCFLFLSCVCVRVQRGVMLPSSSLWRSHPHGTISCTSYFRWVAF